MMPLSRWTRIASSSCLAPSLEKPARLTYPTVPPASAWEVTSRRWILARTIVTSNSSRSSRCVGVELGAGRRDRCFEAEDVKRALGPRLAPNAIARLVGREAIERRAVDRVDDVAGSEPGRLSRRARNGGDDHEMAVRTEGGAVGRIPGGVNRPDLGADPTVEDPDHHSTPRGWAEYAGHSAVAALLAAAEPPG